MADKKTILKAFSMLRAKYPNYFKDKSTAQIDYLISLWANNFKRTPDERLLSAVNLVIRDSNFFPDVDKVQDKLVRVTWIEDQKKTTYLSRVRTLEEMESATKTDVENWVDVRRFLFPTESCTTKDFKEHLEIARQQVEKAKAELTEDQRRELNIQFIDKGGEEDVEV